MTAAGGRLADKVCLSTGAGSGIRRRASALAIAAEGATVAVPDISPIAAEMRGGGRDAEAS